MALARASWTSHLKPGVGLQLSVTELGEGTPVSRELMPVWEGRLSTLVPDLPEDMLFLGLLTACSAVDGTVKGRRRPPFPHSPHCCGAVSAVGQLKTGS